MSKLLYGETLVWVSYDPRQVFTAGLRGMLEEVLGQCQLQLWLAQSLEQLPTLVEQQRAGLATLALGREDQVAAWRVLRRLFMRSSDCLRYVYFPEHYLLDEMRLREAGAQMVAKQIPWLQQHLPSLAAQARRRSGGHHPLTTGLIDRLPWKQVGPP